MELIFILVGVYIIMVVGFYYFQEKFIFQPKPLEESYTFKFDLDFETFYLEDQEKQLKVNSLFFPSQSPTKGLVLYMHGNADNLQRWGRYAEDFHQHGYDFLSIDYPGYGKSPGSPSEEKCYQSAELAYHWAIRRYPEHSIILYGRSLGTGAAAYLAAQYPAQQLILETPFPSIPKLIRFWIPGFIKVRHKFPVEQYLKEVKYPVTIFQGTWDIVVPHRAALQLKPHLACEGDFISIEKGRHKNLRKFQEYQKKLEILLAVESIKKAGKEPIK
ncbi:MAG: alpha/beta hydrolase [Saprospiraceae bacterium]|nr:MAG: alpha/beta hydrolase [Saprospiraceae bacterium]